MKYFALICLVTLTACGFQPVHGTKTEQTANIIALEEIKVEVPAKGRLAQLYRIALEDSLHPSNLYPTPKYRLTSAITEVNQPIIIQRDASIVRYNLVLKATYELTDIASGTQLAKKKIQRISSYNVSDSDFATFIAKRNAREQGIKALAKDLSMKLAATVSATQ